MSVPSSMLRVRAGHNIIDMIRSEGLRAERISAFVGPALGPRWTATAGIDHALAVSDFLKTKRRTLLVGGSAGAWRITALAQKDPVEALSRFRDVYVSMNFDRGQDPKARTEVLKEAVRKLLPREEAPYLLNHPHYDLCIDTARVSGLLASSNAVVSVAGFGAAMALNAVSPRLRRLFLKHVRFCAGSGPFPPPAPGGLLAPLNSDNVYPALAASGAVPVVLQGMRDIPGAPAGVYCDGGLEQYVLNGIYGRDAADITLLVYHGGPIIPTWLDRKALNLNKRIPPLDNVLAVSPSPEFIKSLPLGKVPDRDDWKRFADNPAERIRIWQTAIDRSMELGRLFMELVEGGGIKRAVEPLDRLSG